MGVGGVELSADSICKSSCWCSERSDRYTVSNIRRFGPNWSILKDKKKISYVFKERKKTSNWLVIDDSVQAKFFQVLDILRVVVVISPTEQDKSVVFHECHSARIPHYFFGMDIYPLEFLTLAKIQLTRVWMYTSIPRQRAKFTADGIVWHRASWYIGYLDVMPWVRNTTGYFACLYFTLKKKTREFDGFPANSGTYIVQISGWKQEKTILRLPPCSNTTFNTASRYVFKSNGLSSSKVPSCRQKKKQFIFDSRYRNDTRGICM